MKGSDESRAALGQQGGTKEVALAGTQFVPICAHEIRAKRCMNTGFFSLRGASCGAFCAHLCPRQIPAFSVKCRFYLASPTGFEPVLSP